MTHNQCNLKENVHFSIQLEKKQVLQISKKDKQNRDASIKEKLVGKKNIIMNQNTEHMG